MEKNRNIIDPERLNRLVAGEVLPDGHLEELLMSAYLAGVSGNLLITFLVGLGPRYDAMSADELTFLTMGYSVGQNDLIKIEDELMKTHSKNNQGLN